MTRKQWLESMTSKELQEIRTLAGEEPVGTDALIMQMAIVAKAMAGGELKDLMVLSNSHQQTKSQMANILKQFVEG